MKEIPAEKIKRLSEMRKPMSKIPIGLAQCGCPNDVFGNAPLLHICVVCGFEGTERLHANCPGCYMDLTSL